MKNMNFIFITILAIMMWACGEEKKEAPIVDMEIDQEILPDMGSSLANRCANLTNASHFLVLYADRVEAFKRDERGFKVERVCTFLALYEQGLTAASAFLRLNDGRFLIAEPSEAGGILYLYDQLGNFISKTEPNINLKKVKGLWLKFDGKIVAWNESNENLYQFSDQVEFMGTYQPTKSSSAKLSKVEDLIFLDADPEGEKMIAVYADRPPQMFAFPQPISWDMADIAKGKAITGVPSQIGIKLLISGAMQGNSGGIALFKPVASGRSLPAEEKLDLVLASDEGLGDGAELVAVEEGIFFVLDQGTKGDGSQSLNSFNSFGILQELNVLPAVDSRVALDVIYTELTTQ